eukprot:TRINITY_DN20735_c0_g1_i1.p1 TRINITY_DN20735_c0_g1~~TRINITY_DN20735_c0_g1_i1.p1  ORF type:complete len:390 (+),score=55.58 TRINITY_DN20735_c0_g1_i1:134-1303(+)
MSTQAEKDKAYEVQDAAKKALAAVAKPLPAPATKRDIVAIKAALAQAHDAGLGPEFVEKPQKLLANWIDEHARHEALHLLFQALHRLDRTGDGKVTKEEWNRLQDIFTARQWDKVFGEGKWGPKEPPKPPGYIYPWGHKPEPELQELDNLFEELDGFHDGKLEFDEVAEHLLQGHVAGTELVKQIVYTAPNGEEGIIGMFGPRLLNASTSVDFEISTEEALKGIDLIGIIFMTSTTVDKNWYPSTMLKENREHLDRLRKFRLLVQRAGEEYETWEKLDVTFEVVVCCFDTTEEAYLKTVGDPPWYVMPWDLPWERDYLWRRYNHLAKAKADPSLVVVRPSGEVVAKRGFEDIWCQPKYWEHVYGEWCEKLKLTEEPPSSPDSPTSPTSP